MKNGVQRNTCDILLSRISRNNRIAWNCIDWFPRRWRRFASTMLLMKNDQILNAFYNFIFERFFDLLFLSIDYILIKITFNYRRSIEKITTPNCKSINTQCSSIAEKHYVHCSTSAWQMNILAACKSVNPRTGMYGSFPMYPLHRWCCPIILADHSRWSRAMINNLLNVRFIALSNFHLFPMR
jgi:hypothetical protein